MTHFILCGGKARHGKDTAAAIIKKILEKKGYSVLITHYADLLKYVCSNFFGWDGNKDERGRSILQHVGTDCIRTQNPNYWVDFVTNVVQMFPDKWDYVVVPDVRFPNEIERVRDAGFPVTHMRIVRRDFDSQLTEAQKNHPSETALDDITPDYLIDNTTLQALEEQLCVACDEIAAFVPVLYTTGCPTCRALKETLDEHNIQYVENRDTAQMLRLGFDAVPMLEVSNREYLDYDESMEWANKRGKQNEKQQKHC